MKKSLLISLLICSNAFAFDDNPLKHLKYIPGTQIQIIDKNTAAKEKIDCLIVFAWNFFAEIKKNNNSLSQNIISIK